MEPAGDIERAALLREPVRRSLYFCVRDSDEPVSRDRAASAVGISRSLAAFHLDRLADAGLLRVEYRRLHGRTGRGAGRPAKLYRMGAPVRVSLPETRYELAGDLLIEALQGRRPAEGPVEALRRSARGYGAALASEMRPGAGPDAVREACERLGFEPRTRDGGTMVLRNCPFHELVERHPDVVCGMNLWFLRGLAEGLAGDSVVAEPYAQDGLCCVALETAR